MNQRQRGQAAGPLEAGRAHIPAGLAAPVREDFALVAEMRSLRERGVVHSSDAKIVLGPIANTLVLARWI
jgi:hypothetical protein